MRQFPPKYNWLVAIGLELRGEMSTLKTIKVPVLEYPAYPYVPMYGYYAWPPYGYYVWPW